MVVVVDLGADPPTIGLSEPDDCARFHVSLRGPFDIERADALMRSSGVGTATGGEAVVRVVAVRQMAGRRDTRWEADFAVMLAYARSKGWLTDDGTGIRAHIEAE